MKEAKKKYVGINLSEKTFFKINKEANQEHRSLSSHIAYVLENWLEAQEKKLGKVEGNKNV